MKLTTAILTVTLILAMASVAQGQGRRNNGAGKCSSKFYPLTNCYKESLVELSFKMLHIPLVACIGLYTG